MRTRRELPRARRAALAMTPMIDIVFQLLVFFIMTFKIIVPEGDFRIAMPRAAPSDHVEPSDDVPPIVIRLAARQDGNLAEVHLNGRRLDGLPSLHREIVRIVPQERQPGAGSATEVEFAIDARLDYCHTIDAISAVSGEVTSDGTVTPLVEKIRFTPFRRAAVQN